MAPKIQPLGHCLSERRAGTNKGVKGCLAARINFEYGMEKVTLHPGDHHRGVLKVCMCMFTHGFPAKGPVLLVTVGKGIQVSFQGLIGLSGCCHECLSP